MGETAKPISVNFINIDPAVCLVCGACVAVCPGNAMTLSSTAMKIRGDLCTLCLCCLTLCPVGALSTNEALA